MKLRIYWKDGDVEILTLQRNEAPEQALQNYCKNMGRMRWNVEKVEVIP